MSDTNEGPSFRTYTGKKFKFLNPMPKDIDVEDIAAALSKLCRYGGHVRCRGIYSVAQHALLVSELAEAHPDGGLEAAYEGLHHDDHEAYIGDMVGPLKREIPQFVEIEHNIDRVIRIKLNLQPSAPPLVKAIDSAMLGVEQRNFHDLSQFSYCDWTKEHDLGYDFPIEPMEPEVAMGIFLARHKDLVQRLEDAKKIIPFPKKVS